MHAFKKYAAVSKNYFVFWLSLSKGLKTPILSLASLINHLYYLAKNPTLP